MQTSIEAYRSVVPVIPNIRDRVCGWISDQGVAGATCDEAETFLNLPHQTCSARILELRQAGRIEATGEKRKTRSGRQAMVYRVSK